MNDLLCDYSMKYWGQIRLILIYGDPRLKLLLLTKPNVHPCLSGSWTIGYKPNPGGSGAEPPPL